MEILSTQLVSERSLIFEIKNEIRVKFNGFVNFFAQTSQFSSGSGCQMAKAETRKIQDAPYMGL